MCVWNEAWMLLGVMVSIFRATLSSSLEEETPCCGMCLEEQTFFSPFPMRLHPGVWKPVSGGMLYGTPFLWLTSWVLDSWLRLVNISCCQWQVRNHQLTVHLVWSGQLPFPQVYFICVCMIFLLGTMELFFAEAQFLPEVFRLYLAEHIRLSQTAQVFNFPNVLVKKRFRLGKPYCECHPFMLVYATLDINKGYFEEFKIWIHTHSMPGCQTLFRKGHRGCSFNSN